MSFFGLDGDSSAESLAAWLELGNSAVAEISGNHDEDRVSNNPAAFFEANVFRAIEVFGVGQPSRPVGVAEIAYSLKEDLAMASFQIFLPRGSVLPVEPARQVEAPVDPDYELRSWQDHCPEELAAAFAELRSMMSTDAPQGEAKMDEQVWDAARVRRIEAFRAGQGASVQVTAARHRGTGELVGYTELSWHPGRPVSALQSDTLVVRAHRGHGLGIWIKTANLRAACQRWPSVERIYTGNAEENAPMLRINQAMASSRTRRS
ncbi:MAG: hypothetical protein L0G87_10155 [Renibacterium salmoninarum]|nr:hypothetical protein [Renibacterium salmoninarum]